MLGRVASTARKGAETALLVLCWCSAGALLVLCMCSACACMVMSSCMCFVYMHSVDTVGSTAEMERSQRLSHAVSWTYRCIMLDGCCTGDRARFFRDLR
jgi:hypothetical protein